MKPHDVAVGDEITPSSHNPPGANPSTWGTRADVQPAATTPAAAPALCPAASAAMFTGLLLGLVRTRSRIGRKGPG
jgi:hypothetical protein